MTNLKVGHEEVSDVLKTTECIIDTYGPRLPGSDACLKVAVHLKKEYEKYCDRVVTIDYDQYPGSFFYMTIIIPVTYIIGVMVYCIPALLWLAMAFYALGLFYFMTQFIFFGNIFDKLFKKYHGKTVYGVVESRAIPRQQIILSAHHDSPHICNFLHSNQKLYAFRSVLPIVFQVYALLASAIVLVSKNAFGEITQFYYVTKIILLIGLFFVIPLFWFNSRKGSPGAGDNLVASVMGIKVAEIVRKHFGSLTNTRIIILSNDGEEIGQKGVRAFIKKSQNLLSECKTYVFNIDCIYKYEDLTFLTSDRNGTIPLSTQLANENIHIATQLGYNVKKKGIPFGGGGTDAAQFAKSGIEATSLIGISTAFIRDGLFYHNSNDTVQNLDLKAIEATIDICLNFILRKEAQSVGAV